MRKLGGLFGVEFAAMIVRRKAETEQRLLSSNSVRCCRVQSVRATQISPRKSDGRDLPFGQVLRIEEPARGSFNGGRPRPESRDKVNRCWKGCR